VEEQMERDRREEEALAKSKAEDDAKKKEAADRAKAGLPPKERVKTKEELAEEERVAVERVARQIEAEEARKEMMERAKAAGNRPKFT
jgi:hypothetical protein